MTVFILKLKKKKWGICLICKKAKEKYIFEQNTKIENDFT